MVHFVDSVLRFGSPLWIFAFLCLAVWTTTVQAEPDVVGPPQPIIAISGDDVILPCHLDPPLNVQRLTVVWSKPDLKPDPLDRLSRVEYVHLYRNQHEVPDMKIQSYVSRTALSADGLKRGNISLKIRNVTVADQGRYKCLIPKLKSEVKEAILELVVEQRSVETWTKETPLHPRDLQTPDPKDESGDTVGLQHLYILIPVLVVLLTVVGAFLGYYLLNYKCRKNDLQKYGPPEEQLSA